MCQVDIWKGKGWTGEIKVKKRGRFEEKVKV